MGIYFGDFTIPSVVTPEGEEVWYPDPSSDIHIHKSGPSADSDDKLESPDAGFLPEHQRLDITQTHSE